MRNTDEATALAETVSEQKISKRSKADSNRKNAEKSTGPTDTSVTRFNATKHGLLATAVGPLDHEGYDAMLAALQDEFSPRGTIENLLIQRLALYSTRLHRAGSLQMEFIDNSTRPKSLATKRRRSTFEKFLLGDEDHEKSSPDLGELKEALKDFPSALAFLAEEANAKDVDKIRTTLDRFSAAVESLTPAPPEDLRFATVPISPATMDVLDQKFQRYETTLENRFFRTLHELERLQRLRAGDAVPAPLTIDVAIHADHDGMVTR